MLSRLWTNLVILVSLLALGAVGVYFYREYRLAERRHAFMLELGRAADEDGPCAALEKAHEAAQFGDEDLLRSVQSRRPALAARVVGEEDRRARAALLSADHERLMDRTLCEQIMLARELGERHPVLELLRFTREGGDACEDAEALGHVLSALDSHRSMMVHALMSQASALGCLPPWLAARLGQMSISVLREQPDAMDDLDVVRVSHFLERWAPVGAAQLGCRAELLPQRSMVAATIGCTPYHQSRILPRYRYVARMQTRDGRAPPDGPQVLLLGEEGERCEVRLLAEKPRLLVVPCRDLSLISDLYLAALIETPTFGLVRAGLIAGLVHYDGASGKLAAASSDPDIPSWYAYASDGQALGLVQQVNLGELAAKLGEELPDNPLTAYCRKMGARYCYDVDWARLVGRIPGDPVVYLSRPMAAFVPEADLAPDIAAGLFQEAFGRPVQQEAAARAFALGAGAHLLVEANSDSVELRWRLSPSAPWRGQLFGTRDRGKASASARLVSVLDLRGEGRPQLVMQRVVRARRGGVVRESSDEVALLALNATGERFEAVSALTVREY